MSSQQQIMKSTVISVERTSAVGDRDAYPIGTATHLGPQ